MGKTTLLKECPDGRSYINLDNLENRAFTQSDPSLFLQRYPPPIIIDEVQHAPELFSAIKVFVDKNKKKGIFWLIGSQRFHLMRNITETLAGREAITDMLGFSQTEIENKAEETEPFIPTTVWIENSRACSSHKSLMTLNRIIWRALFPTIWVPTKTDKNIAVIGSDC